MVSVYFKELAYKTDQNFLTAQIAGWMYDNNHLSHEKATNVLTFYNKSILPMIACELEEDILHDIFAGGVYNEDWSVNGISFKSKAYKNPRKNKACSSERYDHIYDQQIYNQ